MLASVPGTPEAQKAVAEARKPKVARISVNDTNKIEVPYIGEPSFVNIPATELSRAENTPFQVIMNNNFYYLCHDGAWYSSSNPTGPWKAAAEVPEAIYTIPPTDPAYNVTFVRVQAFDDSSDQVAYTSESGYYNRYYNGYTMVYGTGWYYPGYYNRAAYWRYPHTYGYGYRYGGSGEGTLPMVTAMATAIQRPTGSTAASRTGSGAWMAASAGFTTTVRLTGSVPVSTRCPRATITKAMDDE